MVHTLISNYVPVVLWSWTIYAQDPAILPQFPFCQFTCYASLHAEKLGHSEDDACS